MAPDEEGKEFIKQQLTTIRERLSGDVTEADLRRMQLQVDVLAQWARLDADEYHNHDHMDDHDHADVALPSFTVRPEARG